MITAIQTEHAPAAIGTYSQAVCAGDFLFVSGQIGLDPKTGALVSAAFRVQAEQAFTNLQAIIEAAGLTFSQVVKLNISVTDMAQFQCFNEVMAQYFNQPYPARAVVEVVGLPKESLVEIEAIVALHG